MKKFWEWLGKTQLVGRPEGAPTPAQLRLDRLPFPAFLVPPLKRGDRSEPRRAGWELFPGFNDGMVTVTGCRARRT